jgi:hypothetical protein
MLSLNLVLFKWDASLGFPLSDLLPFKHFFERIIDLWVGSLQLCPLSVR